MPDPRDPLALALCLGLLAGPLGAALVRQGARLAGALGAAALAAAAAAALGAGAAGAAVAGAAAATCAWLLPGTAGARAGLGRAFERAGFAGTIAEARLPARLCGAAPSRLLDAADALRLERAALDAEAKSGAELAVALVRHADVYPAARWRAAAWLAALALAGAAALAPALTPRGALGTASAGALAGFAAARASRVRRFFAADAALGARAEARALDAFARAGLGRAPDGAGVLLFAALFEGRALALADRGAAGSPGAWDDVARAAAAGLAEGAAAEGLARALECAGAAAAAARSGRAPGDAPAGRPPPVVVED